MGSSGKEAGWTVPPEKGIELLEEGRKGAYALLERIAPQVLESDSFLGALASAYTGYANALREVEKLRRLLKEVAGWAHGPVEPTDADLRKTFVRIVGALKEADDGE